MNDLSERIDHYPFLVYAGQLWGTHMRESWEGSTETLETMTFSTLRDNVRLSAITQIRYVAGASVYSSRAAFEFPESLTALHTVSYFDLHHASWGLLGLQTGYSAQHGWQQTPLHVAAAEGHVQLVTRLVVGRCDPNFQDRNGRTTLRNAAIHGHSDVISRLLNHGAIIGIEDVKGLPEIQHAILFTNTL